MEANPNKTPATVLMVILLLALIEPLTHFWIVTSPPEGMVPTGVHTGDSAHHLVAMEALSNGGYSPYVSCENDPYALNYFAAPIFLLYAVLGEIARMLHLNMFMALGLFNGLAGGLYLWCVWRFFRLIAQPFAEMAFYLFALGGGLGGVLYLLALLLGLNEAPQFQDMFLRYAAYDLIEGQHRSPLLLMPRAYYTIPLALGIASLTAFIESERIGCRAHLFFAGFLMLVCTLINIRIGPVIWGVGVLYIFIASKSAMRECIVLITSYGLYCMSGGLLFYVVLLNHPSYSGNVYNVGHQIMGIVPFLSATLFFWPPLLNAFRRILAFAPLTLRCAIGAGLGYFYAYLLLYTAYQFYWGNVLVGGDVKAGTVVSDWALLGAVLGAEWYQFRVPKLPLKTNPMLLWLALWCLGLLVISISAWGQGWTIRFSPQRFMILLPLPMALLTAYGIMTLPKGMGRACYQLSIGCGVIAIAVGSFFFQGHGGKQGPEQPFSYLHYAHMKTVDAELIPQMKDGFVLTPPWSPIAFGEILAQREGLRIVGGPGAMNLGDLPFGEIQADVQTFWHPETSDAARRAIAEKRCINYVYSPATAPANAAVLEALRHHDWLIPLAEQEGATLYEVVLP